MEINLGDKAKDTITGFTGIVIAVTKWLHGCERITLQPDELNKDGNPIESRSFDAPQIKVLKSKAHRTTADTGGPQPEPYRGR